MIQRVYNITFLIEDSSKVIPFFGYALNRYKEETKQEPKLTIDNGQAIHEFNDGSIFILMQYSQTISISSIKLETLINLEKKMNTYISSFAFTEKDEEEDLIPFK